VQPLVQPDRFGHAETTVLVGLIERISRAESASEIYELALDAIMSALRAERTAILLFDADGAMRFEAWRGISDAYRRAVEGHTPWKPEEAEAAPFAVADVRDDPSLAPYAAALAAEKIRALAFIPLVAGRRVIGQFMIYFGSPQRSSSEELRLGQAIASQVAHAAARASSVALARSLAELQRRLLDVSGALAQATTESDVLSIVVRAGVEGLGAHDCALWLIDERSRELRIVRQVNYDATRLRRFESVALDSAMPLAVAARTGEPVWSDSRRTYADAYGDLESRTSAMSELAVKAFACLPLTTSKGPLGAFAVGFETERVLAIDERTFLMTIARQGAHSLQRLTLHEAERHARLWLERLHEVIAALSTAVSVEEVATLTTRRACEVLGLASSALWMTGPSGDLTLVATHGTSVVSASEWQRIEKDAIGPPGDIARTGRAAWIETDEEHRALMAGGEHTEVPRSRSYALLPLRVHDRILGVVGFSRVTSQTFGADERRYLETLTAHAAQGLERAQLFEAERRARTDAETANRAKDQFLATMSHELRTPLNAISGWVQMLRSGTLNPDRHAHAIRVIERNARIQEQLIGDLLDMSRVISGRLRLEVERIDVADIARSALDSIRPTADAKNVELELHVEPADLVRADASRLQQIAWNLLTNAVKFTPEGGRVRVSVREETPNVVLSVRDSGQGIPAAFLPHIFEPFRQADGSYGRVHGGLGLGLAITRTLVEMHGGTIDVRSEGQDLGAEFVVRLPVESLRPESTRRVPTLEPTSIRPPAAPRDTLAGARILVVEDEPDSRELLLSLLEAYGAKTFGAATAAEAIEKLALARPDVIVSDIGLPGEDGLSLMRRIRSLPGPRVPAIALTAFSRPEDRERTAAAGFDVHVGKPIDPERLIEHLNGLRRRAGGPS
jgi:signal transduction histidine kinase/CheY-like chemotaxis protein